MSSVKQLEAPKLSRRGRARATQWRIVKAAYGLFCAQGYAGTAMAEIADAAGVAVQTVYFTFHTKAALLSRAYDFAVMGEDDPQIPQHQPWYLAMAAEPKVTEALRHFLTGVGEITRRVTPLAIAAQVAADGDPETARVIATHDKLQADSYREVVELLSAKAQRSPGLDLERATDLLLLYAGTDVYHVLVEGRGWSHDEWLSWAATALSQQLFGG
ncbi:MAG TPA: helix-turn-helix domain-containing protein [Candidatus Dormibacteraeota bacterium]|nr:helix-turn-helix domain-containing protein [Candidatus Dormibacteraeota bacterium]